MLTSEIIPLDPAGGVSRKQRPGLPWRWIIGGVYVAGALACFAAAVISRIG
jgi:hypothetical protein